MYGRASDRLIGMSLSLTQDQARRLRVRSNCLLPPGESSPTSVDHVLQAVCGVQAQELPAALLSVRARSRGLASADVEQARQAARTIVRTWLMRGTLHLAAAADAAWLVPFLAPNFIPADRRRMAELGWDEPRVSRGLRLLRDALEERGALTRPEIAHLFSAEGLPFAGQATVHLIFRAAFEGLLCYGPDRGKEPTYLHFEEWIGPLLPRPRPDALAELARRYLEAYAPAGPQDLATWSGLTAGEARQAWSLIEELIAPVEITGQPAWILKGQLARLDEIDRQPVSVRLLPRYDTYLLGYAHRDLAVASQYEKRIHPGGGQIGASLSIDGRVVGTWKSIQRRGSLAVSVEPFEPLSPDLIPLLVAEVQDLGRFLGIETSTFSLCLPSPPPPASGPPARPDARKRNPGQA